MIKKLPVTQRHIIGIDLKEVTLEAPGLVLFQGDASDQNSVKAFLSTQQVTKFDLILSDMAPDTIGTADIDAVRSIALIEKTLWIYEQLLAPTGKFAIKVFMGP